MRGITRAIDRFCYRHPRFGIPHLIRIIVFGTGLVYILSLMVTDNAAVSPVSFLFFSPRDILGGQVWRVLSFLFVPTQRNPIWFAIGLYITYMLGTSLERTWGTAKFNIYILLNVIVLAGAGMIVHLAAPRFSAATALFVSGYYIQTFLILTFITLYADSTFQLYFVLPIRAKWLGFLMAGALIYDLFFELNFLFPLNLLPFVLLIPYLIFCGETLLGYIGFGSVQNSKATIDFKRAAKKVERERETKAYTRKCAVCGKTDTDFPDMEFRYCSKCNGYHCFCLEHINNHIHFE